MTPPVDVFALLASAGSAASASASAAASAHEAMPSVEQVLSLVWSALTPGVVGWTVLGLLVAAPFYGLWLWRDPASVDHHNPGFVRKWIFSTDHKTVGIQFLFTILFLFLIGGGLALAVRWQLAWPFDPKRPIPMADRWGETFGFAEVPQVNKDAQGRIVEYLASKVEVIPTGTAADKVAGKPDLVGRVTGTVEPAQSGVGAGEGPGFRLGADATVYRMPPTATLSGASGTLPPTGSDVAVWYAKGRVMPDNFYLTLMTMHASVMIFLVIVPGLVGVFGNYVMPLQIGAGDMAFPRLNMFTYWLMPLGAYLMLLGFLVGGEEAGKAMKEGTAWAAAGWTSYPPLSVLREAAPGGGTGQTTWALSIIVLGFSAVLGSINYITTIVKMRAPGLTMFRLPLTVWSVLITSILSLFSTPVLASALLLLACDRLLHTSFFTPTDLVVTGKKLAGTGLSATGGREGGGQVLLFQHLFWFYSHPAVYLMILPAMGIVSDVLATFARKALFGYHMMVVSVAAIAGLGFVVWGHHMFQSGMNPWVGQTFAIATMLIALPSGVKTFNWLATLWGGQIRFTTAMLNALAFVSMFVIGGLSGIYMAATPTDVQLHATYFIVGHIHYVLFGGSTFAIFAGIYYWYPKMFGRMMSERLGVIHFILTFISFNGVFFPMHILGAAGMHRRIADPYVYELLKPMQELNVVMTVSAIVLGLSQIPFAFNFLGSLVFGRKAEANPWKSNTLEWQAASPPPPGNFERIPEVVRGPYEYGSPESAEDWLPQNAPATGGDGHGHSPSHGSPARSPAGSKAVPA
jgi:cytochrome c oxidase subunit 1